MDKFKPSLKLFKDRNKVSWLTTGNTDLDSLLGGGIKPGYFYLFYGDKKSGVDVLIHRVLANCLVPKERQGFSGKAVYSNCGNYRKEKTLLDLQLLSALIKAAGLDPIKALDDIHVLYAFSADQQEQMVGEVQELLNTDPEIKLVVVHNIAKLFTTTSGHTLNQSMEKITKLQKVVMNLWQACAKRTLPLVASCRPTKGSRGAIPPPEGGKYLRHKANVIVYFENKNNKPPFITADLRKHPNRAPRKTTFTFTGGGSIPERPRSFQNRLQEQIANLRSYRRVLSDSSRRTALDRLVKTWSSEQGAMRYVQTPTLLDIMLLTAIIDNRKLVDELFDQADAINAKITEIQTHLETSCIRTKT